MFLHVSAVCVFSFLCSIHTLSEYTIVYLLSCPCTPELFQVFSSYELGCYTSFFVGICLHLF